MTSPCAALQLIDTYYADNQPAKAILLAHSREVAGLAGEIAERVGRQTSVDLAFVEEAALLHDIGMLETDVPKLFCYGRAPYIAHGVIGATLLRREGLPRHARVCERHIGVGLSIKDITDQQLPLPHRDMRPQTLEEIIVTYADLFFSKTRKGRRSVKKVRSALSRRGRYKVAIFDAWHQRFGLPEPDGD
ncbi:MAG: HD domain-containing protein [Desulfuromonadales bacterium]